MAEVLVRYTTRIIGDDGVSYLPQACGGIASDGLWEGWIEFVSEGNALRSPRETEQPNRDALMYWAEGLTDTYLQGALRRALTPRSVPIRVEKTVPSVFAGPATGRPLGEGPVAYAVLDPFATYTQGESILHRQLTALSRDHVINIIRGYRLDVPVSDDTMSDASLVDAVVAAVRRDASRSARRTSRTIEQRAGPAA